jgi:hypothetical protein
VSQTSRLEPSAELQLLVEGHLRDSLMLQSVMKAEKASLSRIVACLQGVPEELHATLVGICMQRVVGLFVADP